MKQQLIKQLSKHLSLSKQEIENLLEIPPNQELGDYAFPCFILAKQFKKNPNQIAQDLANKISSPTLEKVEAKGPYINFFLDRTTLAKETLAKIKKEKNKYGSSKKSKKTTMIEFSQANTHKAFHIGHVRGTALGESIAKILSFSGEKVIRANYQGDTGMHVAKWIWCYKKFHAKEKLKKDESWIANIYVESVKNLAENEELQEEVNEINRKLDSQEDKKLNDLWKKTRQLSLDAFEDIYKELNTKFEKYYFESEMEKSAKEIVQELLNKKIAEISDGAVIVNLEKYNLGIWVALRSDGTALYSAKDLALARKKFRDFKIEKSIHVVGSAQKLYFHQLFKVLELMNFKREDSFVYLPVSEVRFPWGKMSSRTGENVLYSEFKNEMFDIVLKEIQKREKLTKKETEKRALAITIAAIKYQMLKQDVNKNLIFNREEALKFEGNTGPYLLYTYARARSILKKAKHKISKLETKSLNQEEKNLLVILQSFPQAVDKAHSLLAPNIIANYSYDLAQAFNEFYHSNKVIGSEEESFRLSLVDACSQVLKNSLSLLNIETLESM